MQVGVQHNFAAFPDFPFSVSINTSEKKAKKYALLKGKMRVLFIFVFRNTLVGEASPLPVWKQRSRGLMC